MPGTWDSLGARGEEAACGFLTRRGYTILARNFRCREGEIDIVARKEEVLVFVEVRTRRSRTFGGPEESVTRAKEGRLVAAANRYLQEHDEDLPWRIDLVGVEADAKGNIVRLWQVESAVEGR
ncbi:MAG: YraN family protein [Chloroflexi bacterium]|nr:YraN family protein [Chloroflexota bacterium]